MITNQLFNNITIVTVTHNSEHIITNFLDTLDRRFNLCVIDNASQDNTKLILKKAKHKNLKLIFNKKGLGFGSAANIGIRKSETKYILLINPDTKINFDSILKLYKASIKYENAAILSPMHKNSDGKVHLPIKPFFYNGKKDSLNIKNFKGDCSVEHLSGAIMLLNKEKVIKIGLFDENFFLYYEDDDLCIKSRKNGFENILVFNTVIEHFAGGSIGPPTIKNQWEKFVNMSFSRCYIEKKYFGNFKANKISISIMLKSIIKLLGHLMTLQFNKTLKDLAHFHGAMIYILRIR
tara:strand:- start:493 stop:1371 length:879 start_codon:yes stop_codon:yes gene_type:complete